MCPQRSAALALAAALAAAAVPAHAQPLRAGSEQPGDPAKPKPGLLKQVGIDQQLESAAAARPDVQGRDRPRRPARRVLRQAAGRPGARLLRVPDALHAGAQRAGRARSSVLTFDAGKEFEVVAVSFDPKDTPALAAEKKQAYLERYKRPQTAAGWHFLTGEEADDQAARRRGRLPLRLRRRDRAVRARRRHRRR